MATTKMFKTQNDIPTATRREMITMLNQELADMSDLYSQTKQAHWNVKGEQFISLHKLFDEFAAALTDYVDDIAERAVQLGGTAMGTNRMSAAETRLKEYPSAAMAGNLWSVTPWWQPARALPSTPPTKLKTWIPPI